MEIQRKKGCPSEKIPELTFVGLLMSRKRSASFLSESSITFVAITRSGSRRSSVSARPSRRGVPVQRAIQFNHCYGLDGIADSAKTAVHPTYRDYRQHD